MTVNHSQSRPAHSLTLAATASARAEAAGETKSARRDGDARDETELPRCAVREASIGVLGADVRGDEATSPGFRGRSPERTIARGGAPGALPPPTGDRAGSVGLESRGGVCRRGQPVGTHEKTVFRGAVKKCTCRAARLSVTTPVARRAGIRVAHVARRRYGRDTGVVYGVGTQTRASGRSATAGREDGARFPPRRAPGAGAVPGGRWRGSVARDQIRDRVVRRRDA